MPIPIHTLFNKPLVSLCLRSHNQKEYFIEALCCAFKQDYTPLEIVIYDDGSVDGSDEIIRRMIAEYRKVDGRHRIVYEHGENGLGNVRAAEKAASLAHGDLLVQNDGDDVSLPFRVSKTVEAWEKGGRRARLILCEGLCIDNAGKRTGKKITGLSAFHPMGALSAYAKDVWRTFPPVSKIEAYDDRPYAFRAKLLGNVLNICEPLVLYRVGVGASTGVTCQSRYRHYGHSMAGVEQNLIDLEYWKDNMSLAEYESLKDMLRTFLGEFQRWRNWLRGDTAIVRFRSRPATIAQMFMNVKSGRFQMLGVGVEMLLVLLPRYVGEPLRNLLYWISRQVGVFMRVTFKRRK